MKDLNQNLFKIHFFILKIILKSLFFDYYFIKKIKKNYLELLLDKFIFLNLFEFHYKIIEKFKSI